MAPPTRAITIVGLKVQQKRIVATLAAHRKHVTDWVGRHRQVLRKAKKSNVKINAAITAYSYPGEENNAHTLTLCIKKKVLVIDLELQQNLPSKLRGFLNHTKLAGNGAQEIERKLAFLGYNFDISEANVHVHTFFPNFNQLTAINKANHRISAHALSNLAKESSIIYDHAIF